MRTYDSNNFTAIVPNEIAHTDEVFLLHFIPKNDSVTTFQVTIDNTIELAPYKTFGANDEILVDCSNMMRAKTYNQTEPQSTTISIEVFAGTALVGSITFDTQIYNGFSVNVDIMPLKIYNICPNDGKQPVIIRTNEESVTLQKDNAGTWEDVATITQHQLYNEELEAGNYQVVYNDVSALPYDFQIIEVADCSLANTVLLKWISENGLKKQWYFKINNEIRRSLNPIEIQTYTDGFKILKERSTELAVIQELADIYTRQYIADVVYASYLKAFYLDASNTLIEIPVTVSQTSLTIDMTERDADISFTLKMTHYDIF